MMSAAAMPSSRTVVSLSCIVFLATVAFTASGAAASCASVSSFASCARVICYPTAASSCEEDTFPTLQAAIYNCTQQANDTDTTLGSLFLTLSGDAPHPLPDGTVTISTTADSLLACVTVLHIVSANPGSPGAQLGAEGALLSLSGTLQEVVLSGVWFWSSGPGPQLDQPTPGVVVNVAEGVLSPTVQVIGCKFSGFSQGAVEVVGSSVDLLVSQSSFLNNVGSQSAVQAIVKTVSLTSCTCEGNSASFQGLASPSKETQGGGAFYVSSSSLLVQSSTFVRNQVSITGILTLLSGGGSAIFFEASEASPTVTVTGSSFTNNSATVSVVYSTLSNQQGSSSWHYGGALMLTALPAVLESLSDIVFAAQLTSTDFNGNELHADFVETAEQAHTGGAGLYLGFPATMGSQQVDLNMHTCSFIKNRLITGPLGSFSTSFCGGAGSHIHVVSNSSQSDAFAGLKVTMTNCVSSENAAILASTIANSSDVDSRIIFHGGGGHHVLVGSPLSVVMNISAYNSSFSSNSLSSIGNQADFLHIGGGDVFALGTGLQTQIIHSFEKCKFQASSVVLNSNRALYHSFSGGGNIFLLSGAGTQFLGPEYVAIDDSLLTSSSVLSVKFWNSTFVGSSTSGDNCTAGIALNQEDNELRSANSNGGGAVAIYSLSKNISQVNVSSSECNWLRNSVQASRNGAWQNTNGGGAIIINSLSELDTVNISFTGNTFNNNWLSAENSYSPQSSIKGGILSPGGGAVSASSIAKRLAVLSSSVTYSSFSENIVNINNCSTGWLNGGGGGAVHFFGSNRLGNADLVGNHFFRHDNFSANQVIGSTAATLPGGQGNFRGGGAIFVHGHGMNTSLLTVGMLDLQLEGNALTASNSFSYGRNVIGGSGVAIAVVSSSKSTLNMDVDSSVFAQNALVSQDNRAHLNSVGGSGCFAKVFTVSAGVATVNGNITNSLFRGNSLQGQGSSANLGGNFNGGAALLLETSGNAAVNDGSVLQLNLENLVVADHLVDLSSTTTTGLSPESSFGVRNFLGGAIFIFSQDLFGGVNANLTVTKVHASNNTLVAHHCRGVFAYNFIGGASLYGIFFSNDITNISVRMDTNHWKNNSVDVSNAVADGAEVTGAVLISAFSHTVNYGNVHLKNDVFQENVMNISDIGSSGFGTFIGGAGFFANSFTNMSTSSLSLSVSNCSFLSNVLRASDVVSTGNEIGNLGVWIGGAGLSFVTLGRSYSSDGSVVVSDTLVQENSIFLDQIITTTPLIRPSAGMTCGGAMMLSAFAVEGGIEAYLSTNIMRTNFSRNQFVSSTSYSDLGQVQNGGASLYVAVFSDVAGSRNSLTIAHSSFVRDTFTQRNATSEKYMVFIGGGSLFVQTLSFMKFAASLVTLHDVTSLHSQATVYGTHVEFQDAHIGGGMGFVMSHGVNVSSLEVTVDQSTFQGNEFLSESTTSLSDTFQGGGALYTVCYGSTASEVVMTNAVLTLLVQDVLMDSNIAFMYSKNQAPSQWLASNSSSSFVGGGSLFAFCDSDIGTAEEKVHISHSTFVYNQAFSNLDNMLNSYIGGGAMYAVTKSLMTTSLTVTVDELSSFAQNSATLIPCATVASCSKPTFQLLFGGGALFVVSPPSHITNILVHISNCTFFDNEGYAGAVPSSLPNFVNAFLAGGALSVIRVSAENKPTFNPCIIEDSVFDNNSLSSDKSWKDQVYIYTTGGGALFDHMNVTILRSNFSNNHAYDGGGAYMWTATSSVILQSHFSNNHGSWGGAISTHSEIDIEGFFCAGNTADSGGCLMSHMYSTITMRDFHFSDNLAYVSAGAVFTFGQLKMASDGDFKGNTAMRYSGALQLAGKFNRNTIVNTTFVENVSHGMAGCISTGISLSLKNVSFFSNHADYQAGTLQLMEDGQIFAQQCTFFNNSAYFNGGVLYNDAVKSHSVFLNSQFLENFAYEAAVLKSTQNANVTFLGCTMSDNEARFEGGVLVLEGTSSAYIHTCEMMSNTAGVDGGVMHITNLASATFEDTTIANNSAGSSGGFAIMKQLSVLYLNNCCVRNNSASIGGALFMQSSPSSALLKDSTLLGNVASMRGGAVSMYPSLEVAGVTLVMAGNVLLQENAAPSGAAITVNVDALNLISSSEICTTSESSNVYLNVSFCGFNVTGKAILKDNKNTFSGQEKRPSTYGVAGVMYYQESPPYGFELDGCALHPEGFNMVDGQKCFQLQAGGEYSLCFEDEDADHHFSSVPVSLSLQESERTQGVSPGSSVKFTATTLDYWNHPTHYDFVSVVLKCPNTHDNGMTCSDKAVYAVAKEGEASGHLTIRATKEAAEQGVSQKMILSSPDIAAPCIDIHVQLTGCPASEIFQGTTCQPCPTSMFLLDGFAEECQTCPQHISCHQEAIQASANYWPVVNQESLTAVLCPYNYCDQSEPANLLPENATTSSQTADLAMMSSPASVNSMSFVLNTTKLCREGLHRRSESVMCGECDQGYSQWSHQCLPCEDHSTVNVNVVVTMLMELLSQSFLFHLFAQSDTSSAETRILFFFAQASSLIFYPQTALLSVFEVFNFQTASTSLVEGCPFYVDGLGILYTNIIRPLLFFPCLLFFWVCHLLIAFGLKRYYFRGRRKWVTRRRRRFGQQNEEKKSCAQKFIEWSSGWRYYRSIVVVIIGVFWQLLFTSINYWVCTHVPGKGSFNSLVPAIQCSGCSPGASNCHTPSTDALFGILSGFFGTLPFVLLILMVCLKRRQRKSLIALGATVPPMPPFWERWLQRGFSFCGGNDEENDRFTIRLYDQNSDVVEDRSSFNKLFRSLAGCFREEWYFWGTIQLARFIVLAVLFLGLALEGQLANTHFSLFCSIIFFLFLQLWARPYRREIDNWLESIQLCILAFMCVMFMSPAQNNVHVVTVIFIIGCTIISLSLAFSMYFSWRKILRGTKCCMRRQTRNSAGSSNSSWMSQAEELRSIPEGATPLLQESGDDDGVVEIPAIANSDSHSFPDARLTGVE